jgi:hypothetical protein
MPKDQRCAIGVYRKRLTRADDHHRPLDNPETLTSTMGVDANLSSDAAAAAPPSRVTTHTALSLSSPHLGLNPQTQHEKNGLCGSGRCGGVRRSPHIISISVCGSHPHRDVTRASSPGPRQIRLMCHGYRFAPVYPLAGSISRVMPSSLRPREEEYDVLTSRRFEWIAHRKRF